MYPPVPNSVNLKKLRFWDQICAKITKEKKFEKMNIKVVISIPLYKISVNSEKFRFCDQLCEDNKNN